MPSQPRRHDGPASGRRRPRPRREKRRTAGSEGRRGCGCGASGDRSGGAPAAPSAHGIKRSGAAVVGEAGRSAGQGGRRARGGGEAESSAAKRRTGGGGGRRPARSGGKAGGGGRGGGGGGAGRGAVGPPPCCAASRAGAKGRSGPRASSAFVERRAGAGVAKCTGEADKSGPGNHGNHPNPNSGAYAISRSGGGRDGGRGARRQACVQGASRTAAPYIPPPLHPAHAPALHGMRAAGFGAHRVRQNRLAAFDIACAMRLKGHAAGATACGGRYRGDGGEHDLAPPPPD